MAMPFPYATASSLGMSLPHTHNLPLRAATLSSRPSPSPIPSTCSLCTRIPLPNRECSGPKSPPSPVPRRHRHRVHTSSRCPVYAGIRRSFYADHSWVAKYLEQNVKASLATYASAMDPSGLAWFLTKRFNVHSFLSTGYIYPYCTRPPSGHSSGP
jgi:hypothetical protein